MSLVLEAGDIGEDELSFIDRDDHLRELALGMANAYAAQTGGDDPFEVVRRATAYLNFLLGKTAGGVQ